MTGERPFEAFELSVLGGDGHVWLSAHSEQGSVYGVPRRTPVFTSSTGSGITPAAWLEDAIRHARTDLDDDARHVGEQLRELAFGVPEIATLFQQTRGVAASRGAQMLLRVLAAPRELSSWPWELILDPQYSARYLTMSRDVHVVRAGRERTYPIRRTGIAPPLNLLLVLSSPLRDGLGDDETPFDLYEEKRALLAELRPLVQRGLLRVDVEDRPSIAHLRARMGSRQRGYHILHYLGHAQPHGLKLEQPSGRGRLVQSVEFSRLLQEIPDMRLAVFAGCETARAPEPTNDEPDAWPDQLSTADHCVRDACPMVIGMQAVLPFGTERLFTRYFYQALTGGRSVADAARLARLAIAEDDHAGGTRLNWAVPCLVVGGSEPGPLVDPGARAVPPAPARRRGARLGVSQGELRFISRLPELRLSVDVMCGRNDVRVLFVLGARGTGKSAFLDRTVEELDTSVVYLLVSARRLLGEQDPLEFLCQRVAELLGRTGLRPPRQNRQTARVWWELLLEMLIDTPLALAIDDADLLRGDEPKVVILRDALLSYARRRGRSRLALAALDDLSTVIGTIDPGRVRTIRLKPLSWLEVWQWIRRNLPVLSRFDESQLSAFYADLPRLEDWEQLADAVDNNVTGTTADLPELVRNLSTSLPMSPTGRAPAPPVFGPESTTPAAPAARERAPRTLRVAVAGPFTSGRREEFARGITQYAAQHHVAGRVDTATDSTSRLAELLALDSPFDANGASTLSAVTQWLDAAREAAADVILLDFGSIEPNELWDRLLRILASDNRLVIASGGISGKPTYPAWCTDALAIGALGSDGLPAAYSMFDAEAGKPDLYAPETVDGSPLAVLVADPTGRGPAFAAMHAIAAAIGVWASDREQSALDVRATLIETALSVPGQNGIRCLDVDRAIDRTRRQVLLDSLEAGPLELHELLAATGMRPELALPLLDDAASTDDLRRFVQDGAEHYENPKAVYLAYASVRETPPGPARTAAMQHLVERVRRLAKRNRYSDETVRAMWESRDEGRRVAALAAIQAVPSLGTAAIVTEGIRASISAFEQYHALGAARALLAQMTHDERAELRAAINDQLGPDGWIKEGTDRRRRAKALLAALDDPPTDE